MQSALYGVSNLKAVAALPPEVRKVIPTSPSMQGKILLRDDQWWADNLEATTQKFQAWQTGYGS
jgi:hypothetical protein